MISDDLQIITSCRSCSSQNLVDILDLGAQPLANDFLSAPDSVQQCYPLSIAFCRDCSLLQLKQTVRKEVLFDRYVWLTGTSRTARDYAGTFFARVLQCVKVSRSDLIIEIASNDGTVLKTFVEAGFPVLGVEPAGNIAEVALSSGVPTLCAYWNRETAQSILESHSRAKIIIARNVIPHVSDLHEVISAISHALDEDGAGIIEFHYGCTILKDLHYDSIYHEHLCYFTIKSLASLLNCFGLYPFHIESSPISGGSHVIYFSKKPGISGETYLHAAASERESMCNDLTAWQGFAGRCSEHKAGTSELLSHFNGRIVIGFGASARSSTYLNYCAVTADAVSAIIDNNLLKQGLYAPGSRIPIVSVEKGLSLEPELIIVLAWNFKDEIIQECQDRGFKGHYLIPFPQNPILLAAESI
ncbi:MAG: class I SAM-dependent methyltransferase [Candidatus Xenobiia bacterium LiM19]